VRALMGRTEFHDKVYALYMAQYEGYRPPLGVTGKGISIGNKDQGIYELADGTHYGTQCCWDFGSVSPDPNKYVTMNTLFFGTGFWGSGAGSGPWFGGDFEGGVWMGGSAGSNVTASTNPSMKVPFALGILHTPIGKYALRVADISTASDLTTAYDGNIPSGKTWGNAGGIVLGVGGDNSNNSYGTFYEGAVTAGAPSNATDLLIMKNIKAVGYTKQNENPRTLASRPRLLWQPGRSRYSARNKTRSCQSLRADTSDWRPGRQPDLSHPT
jgi:non-reducing end alpha-L-arabinofuranosidase